MVMIVKISRNKICKGSEMLIFFNLGILFILVIDLVVNFWLELNIYFSRGKVIEFWIKFCKNMNIGIMVVDLILFMMILV